VVAVEEVLGSQVRLGSRSRSAFAEPPYRAAHREDEDLGQLGAHRAGAGDQGFDDAVREERPQFEVISTLPYFTQLVPSSVLSGLTLEAAVGPGPFISLRLDGKRVTTLTAGRYTIVVNDKTASHNFHLTGLGIDRSTGLGARGRSTWTLTLGKGAFRFASDSRAGRLIGSFKVVSR
jgi:hypothetical protein